MSIRNKPVLSTLALSSIVCVLALALASISTPVRADGAGAFIGGVFAAKMVDNMQRRTEAQEVQAANSVPRYSAPVHKSAEQRIQELNNLKAGGYITEAEYKQKKQAILNSM